MAEADKTVLVIDDDPDARTFLTTVLEDAGIGFDSAKDGVEALAKIKANPPDLIALDITMPEKSGVAVYRALKDDDRYKDIPVIIITGVSDDFKQFISSRHQIRPPEGYIAKPVEHEQFLRMVQKHLGA